jgi:hypothetical protein
MGKPKSKKKSDQQLLAKEADKYLCYQQSVQSPDHEIEFFEHAYHEAFGRRPMTLREDFCGTFAICCDWVRSHRKRTAVGVDLDAEPLKWGRENNLAKLKPTEKARVRLRQQDVRSRTRPVDILTAQNFSFWIFKTRSDLRDYYRVARTNIKNEGILILDMMGGSECYDEQHTDVKTVQNGKHHYKYLWKHVRFNPITNETQFHISFKFRDGSRLKKAFQYDWRFWSIPEVRELLAEAGFRESHVYWEDADENGEDTGIWTRRTEAPSDPSWIAYVVGLK